jgi:hypothetical protein
VDPKIKRFLRTMSNTALKEEGVLAGYCKLLGIEEMERPFGTDGYYAGTLYEFKEDWNMARKLPFGLAQCCTYLYRWLRKGVYRSKTYALPVRVAVCDRNEAIVVPVAWLQPFLQKGYDWTLAASSPDARLVQDLAGSLPSSGHDQVYDMTKPDRIEAFIWATQHEEAAIPLQITVENFVDVFLEWKDKFFQEEVRAHVMAEAYLLDLQLEAHYSARQGSVVFPVKGAEAISHTTEAEYQRFWRCYLRPPTNEELQRIFAARDQLVAVQSRRQTGEFFTPPDFAAHGHQALLQALPDEHPYTDYVWWDPCCGTANLTYNCPRMPGRLFLSTLEPTDIEVIKRSGQNPEACLFQFDFLNDPDDKLPEELKRVLADKTVPLLFMVNPPWAAGAGDVEGGRAGMEAGRKGVSGTKVQTVMVAAGFERAALQNLYTQTLFRIGSYCVGREAVVACYTMASWPHAPQFTAFSKWWSKHFLLLEARSFDAQVFQGTAGGWPALYNIWGTR